MAINAISIDPRDTDRLDNFPTYRVYFFDQHGSSDEWQLTGARSVGDVMEWVAIEAVGRNFVVYVEARNPGGSGLLRIAGMDPTEQ